MAEADKVPEIANIDETYKLLEICNRSAGDAGLRATYASARAQLGKLNQVMQDQVDKQRADAHKAWEAEQRKAAADLRAEQRKAEDAAAKAADEKATKADEEAAKAEKAA